MAEPRRHSERPSEEFGESAAGAAATAEHAADSAAATAEHMVGSAADTTKRAVDSTAAAAERASAEAARQAEKVGETLANQTEQIAAGGRQGLHQAARAAETGAKAALRSGVTIADGVREIATTWTHYAEEVMRRNSEAGQALLRCRNWNEILEVQAGLLRDNMHAFLDQSAKVAEIGSRMATRPLEALAETEGDRPR
ncbi:MAG TPA: phasin family protein [Stellaceae bacterium]|nr:phasin family protein [Stellaceae bacterium]